MKKTKRMRTQIKICLLLIVAFAISVTGCRKDPAIDGGSTNRINTQTTTSATGTPIIVTYSYDGSGRQVQARVDTEVTVYTYAASLVTKITTLAGVNFETDYTLNSAGLAAFDSKGYAYKYDSSGYLISLIDTNVSTGNYDSTFYTVHMGNADTVVQHQGDQATSNVITTIYTYQSNTDLRDFGLSFTGQQNKNLINTATITQIINGSIDRVVYTYNYTIDSRGRVSQQVVTSGTATYTTSYIYY